VAQPPSHRPGHSAERPLQGIVYAIAGTGSIAIVDGLAKWLVAGMSTFQLLAIRSVFVLLLLVPLIWRAGGLVALRTHRPHVHILRLALTMVSILSFFEALRHLPLATTSMLTFSYPLFMTLLSRVLLREHVDRHRWSAVLVGFLGVLLIARPGGEVADTWAAFLAIFSGMTYASSLIVVRWAAHTETDMSFVFYNNLGSLTFGVAVSPFVWTPPAALDVFLIAAMAVMLISAQMFMVKAFRHAAVAVVAPFTYGEIAITVVIGYVVWGDFPGPQVWAGAIVIVGSGVYMTLRETRFSRLSAKPAGVAVEAARGE
jgi:drug/metabolite transporter (DMT)-like permease